MSKIGVIGGSGLYDISGLRITEDREVETPYGRPSAPYRIGEIEGIPIAFLPRHGQPHSIPPHKINYRANLWGFKSLGVERLISVSATGGINPSLKPGDIVLLDQIIDMTMGARASTFYEADEVVHIDFTEPYCPELRQGVLSAGKKTGIAPVQTGAYICTNGPRLESRAEIKFFSAMGADVVGMTGMPEACLARELEICFSGICLVTNHAAGIAGKKLSAVDVIEKMKEANLRINSLLRETFVLIPAERGCLCKDGLKDARV
ncbi:MAG: S-methyl-5'-thioadenosine phosphorylase [Thermodesulfovibrionales bacterium]|nr:S-methyl-5'-thioadenosine phosphorylase [Thermodesulfovibrionales bacterium]